MDTTRVPTVVALVLTLWLAACSLAPEYQRPAAPIPSSVTDAGYGPDVVAPAAGQPADAAAPGWRDFFTDDQLRALIAEGLQQNRDLKLAVLACIEYDKC